MHEANKAKQPQNNKEVIRRVHLPDTEPVCTSAANPHHVYHTCACGVTMTATQTRSPQDQAVGQGTNNTSQTTLNIHNFDIAKAVQQQRLQLNMSQLLGCDYIFVNPHNARELFNPARIALSIQELVDILEVKPQQVAIILVDESANPRFTRHDFTWNKGRIEQVNASAITAPDQIEFMDMMLDCSTLY